MLMPITVDDPRQETYCCGWLQPVCKEHEAARARLLRFLPAVCGAPTTLLELYFGLDDPWQWGGGKNKGMMNAVSSASLIVS